MRTVCVCVCLNAVPFCHAGIYYPLPIKMQTFQIELAVFGGVFLLWERWQFRMNWQTKWGVYNIQLNIAATFYENRYEKSCCIDIFSVEISCI